MKKETEMQKNQARNRQEGFAFGKENYIILIIGIVLLIIGFVLMSGGGSEDPAVFSEEIFSSRRITIAPVICLLGFGTIVVAIMKKSKD